MSLKSTIFFSVWTSFWCSVFNAVFMYLTPLQVNGNFCPWIMFVCLAVFFGMNSQVKDTPALMLSATCGVFWGQVDLILMTFGVFGSWWFGFWPILVGTTITMIIHIFFLGKTPAGAVPFIFACVALTFATQVGLANWTNILGLWLSVMFGLCLCALCAWGQAFAIKKWTPAA